MTETTRDAAAIDAVQWDGTLRPSFGRRMGTRAFVSLMYGVERTAVAMTRSPPELQRIAATELSADEYQRITAAAPNAPNTAANEPIAVDDVAITGITPEPSQNVLRYVKREARCSMKMMVWRRFFRRFRDLQTAVIADVRQPFLAIVCPPNDPYTAEMIKLPNTPLFKVAANEIAKDHWDAPDRCILYLHGGGYVSGDYAGYRGLAVELSKLAKCPVFVCQYRLAPEVSVPESVSDVIDAVSYISSRYRKYALMGDSAGGGLSLLTIQRILTTHIGQAAQQTLPLPSVCALMSPAIDLAAQSDSYQRNHPHDCVLYAPTVKQIFAIAACDEDKHHPSKNALYGPWDRRCPPLLIAVGEDEILLDDSIRFYARACAGGANNVTLDIFPNVFHTWQLYHSKIPEAEKDLKDMTDFVVKHL
eukprot:TRINITY_DN1493_c0_g1_i1.p1 TRINITY_DN1493_c0_g1~~TRINITY_DN1493_c0_g1_i1.p1  ORF type:complete len:419 (-),score=102.11 TRINITY_DN1493_c0_g1_i1:1260-2516(-)